MQRVVILGATGSIGTQSLDVIRAHRDHYEVIGLAAGRDSELLAARAAEFGVPADSIVLGAHGPDALADLAGRKDADVVINGVVGFAGLPATIAAVRAGTRLGLANKESLIAAGPVVAKARAEGGGEIVPVDSEHSAVWQCLRAGQRSEVRRILLTASGGPFRGRAAADLVHVTVEDALQHPTWSMGPKITIDSSTLINKGLEVIEAHELFGLDFDQIEVVVHPQSIVHSMVEFCDGSVLAQLGVTDMKLPVQYALSFPARVPAPPSRKLDFSKIDRMHFAQPDRQKFP